MTDFDQIPWRVFLDSSVLQTLQDYGEFIFENVYPSVGRMERVPGGYNELEALRLIFAIADRAPAEFALSTNSLREVDARGDHAYLLWAYDILDHWQSCLEGYGAAAFTGTGKERARVFDDPTVCGYLSSKDRLLIRDAIEFESEAFLTMEKRLPKNAPDIQKRFGLQVLRPSQYWNILRPWAGLFH